MIFVETVYSRLLGSSNLFFFLRPLFNYFIRLKQIFRHKISIAQILFKRPVTVQYNGDFIRLFFFLGGKEMMEEPEEPQPTCDINANENGDIPRLKPGKH